MNGKGRTYGEGVTGPTGSIAQLERINRTAVPGSELEQWGFDSLRRDFQHLLSMLVMSNGTDNLSLNLAYIEALVVWLPEMSNPRHGTFMVSKRQFDAYAQGLPCEIWAQLEPLLVQTE